ncbi:hypothetical protein HAX54_047056 [Datura stramonium]|uniref:Uncharacterized protein n=1 Tax=Datura stramonium TaxID=4076 RepID=A0ABS8WJP0_DATST|nr:hypothetical protein [Datura stramonium]
MASHLHFFLVPCHPLSFLFRKQRQSLSPDHAALLLIQKDLGIQGHALLFPAPAALQEYILNCRKLEILDLQNNWFSGKVPSELSSLIRLRVVDFSSNEFSGNLKFLKYFPNLEKLSLADNMFTGKIPASLKSFRIHFLNISGNSFLEGPLPFMSQVEHLSADLTPKTISFPSVIFLLKTQQGQNRYLQWHLLPIQQAPQLQHPHPVVLLHQRITPLIKKAEDLAFLEKRRRVASLEMIGKGGCGEVYRAELPGSNGKIIAIKKIIQPPMDAAELTEEDTKALNKKMRQDILQQVTEGTRELDWLERHRIAAGIAAGLARIADFGLAKAVPDAHTHVTTSNVAGTLRRGASRAGCELPSDDFFQHTSEMSLVKWLRNVMTSDDPKRAIDSKLIGNGYEEQMLLVLKIACFCTLDNPKERPSSKDVRCMLTQIKH